MRINLLPVRDIERVHGERQRRALTALILAVALLMMLVPYRIQAARLIELEQHIVAVQAEISRYDGRVREVQQLDRLKAELRAKLRVIDDLHFKRVGPARVLSDLSSATPDDLWLADFKETHGTVTLAGMALDNRTIALFMRQLEASPYFLNVDLVETTQAAPGQDGSRLQPFKRFIINASIDYFGRDGEPVAGANGPVTSPAASPPPPAQPEP